MLLNTVEEWWNFETGSITGVFMSTICWSHVITIYNSLWGLCWLRRLLRPASFLITASFYWSNLSSKEFITFGFSERRCVVVNNLDRFIRRILNEVVSSKEFITFGFSERRCVVVNNLDRFIRRILNQVAMA